MISLSFSYFGRFAQFLPYESWETRIDSPSSRYIVRGLYHCHFTNCNRFIRQARIISYFNLHNLRNVYISAYCSEEHIHVNMNPRSIKIEFFLKQLHFSFDFKLIAIDFSLKSYLSLLPVLNISLCSLNFGMILV